MKLQFVTARTLQMHKILILHKSFVTFFGIVLYACNGRKVLQFIHEHTVAKWMQFYLT